jgi:hypothetical protein
VRRDQLLHLRVGAIREAELQEPAAAEVRRLVLASRDLHPQASTSGTDVVESRDRLGDMERLGVCRDHGRNQSDSTNPKFINRLTRVSYGQGFAPPAGLVNAKSQGS